MSRPGRGLGAFSGLLTRKETTMALVMMQALVSDDLWMLPAARADIRQLQAKDFTKWLRKIIREHGRRAVVGSQQRCPVEVWVQDVTGLHIGFISGGEVEIEGQVEVEYTDWTSTTYYMFDEAGNMVVEAGKMLDIILLDNQEAYLIAR